MDCVREPKILDMPELWANYQGELHTGNENRPREKCAASAKQGGWSHW